MDLKDFLLNVFPKKDKDKYTKMFDNLKRLGFSSVSDLKCLDDEAVKELESFTRIEIKMLKEKLANCDDSDHYNRMMIKQIHKSDLIPALCEIFIGTDVNRILEIEKTLKNQEITAKKDLIYIDAEKFTQDKILSEIEVSKIVTFLEENYKVQYNKIKDTMELEKSKELRHVMNKIFVGTSTNRLEKIEQILIEAEIYSGRDVLFSDLNSFHLKESLSNYEMSKLEEYIKEKNVEHYEKIMSDRELEKSQNLKSVLEQIFMDTPDDRLAEIEKRLKEERLYSGSDMKIVDTNDLRKKKFLSDVEILEIEEYIKKNNRERYEEIKAVKMAEEERKFARLKMEDKIKFYTLKCMEEIKFVQLKMQDEQKVIEYKAKGKKRLIKEESELKNANAEKDGDKEIMTLKKKIELMKSNAQEEMEKEKIEMQREMEMREAKLKEEMRIEKIKMQTEKEFIEAKATELMERQKIEMQREIKLIETKVKEMERKMELKEAKLKEEFEREKINMQREKELSLEKVKEKMEREMELREANVKEEMERLKIGMQRLEEPKEPTANKERDMQIITRLEINKMYSESLAKERDDLLDDIRDLETECSALKNAITEADAQSGFMSYFKKGAVEKKKQKLKSKKQKLNEIDELLKSLTGV